MEWTSQGAGVYTRDDSQVIINVEDDGTALTEAASSSVSAGEWFYDVDDGTLYVHLSGSSDPADSDVYITYRYFFSNIPINLPYDLSTGAEVFYDGRFNGFSPISFDLDDENVGIAIESNTSVTIENTDGFFDDIFDVLFWEYKTIRIYQFSSNLAATEAQKVFEGVIEDKAFSQSKVTFKCKDFVYQLRQDVVLENFDSSDGDVPDTYLDKPKRRIYGQVEKARCVPIDAIKNGYELTGTITATTGGTTLTGSGTSFLDEVSPNDKITFFIGGQDVTEELNVKSVDSDTQITVDDTIKVGISSATGYNVPEIPWRKKNRNWHIAGHKLRAPSTTITAVVSANRITLASVADFFVNDRILVDGSEVATISNISGNTLTLNQNLNTIPSISDTVTKEPVSRVFVGVQEYVIERDFTVSNTSTDAILQFKNTAEFNVASLKVSTGSFTFTNASRTVTVSGIDALNIFKPRDWIKPDDITYSTYYEILAVAESSITLRVAFADGTTTDGALYKNVNIIGDESVAVVNCVGKELSSTWLKTGAHAVEDLITNDAGLTVNASSFTKAKGDAPYILSYIIPKEIGDEAPSIRETIDDINKTVFGSLFLNSDLEISYSVVSPQKPANFTLVEQDDIIGDFRVSCKNEVIRKFKASYRPFYDTVLGENTFKSYEYQNTFVTRAIGATEDRDITIFLYNDADAEIITQRYAYISSLSRSLVTFKTDLRLTNLSLNSVLKINFRRLYKRFGNRDRIKLGLISKITKSNNTVQVELNDLGNLYNRVANWSANTASAFSGASDEEKALNGYWVDNTREVPDTSSEAEKDQNRFA